ARLRPLVADARPTIRDLRLLIRRAGPNNDLIELTGKAPQLDRIARTTFPDDITALEKSMPMISYARPYSPDLTGWITHFAASATGTGGSGYKVRAIFDDAASAVPGEDVRIAGAKVGSVASMQVTPQKKAAIVLRIERSGFTPFHADAHCTIRPQSLIGEKY